jgi:hypothetical protein
MKTSGLLTRLSLAWSRDGAEKFYVQDRMREVGRELWNWLADGAHIYVCGDAKRMAKDVERALVDIVASSVPLDRRGDRLRRRPEEEGPLSAGRLLMAGWGKSPVPPEAVHSPQALEEEVSSLGTGSGKFIVFFRAVL